MELPAGVRLAQAHAEWQGRKGTPGDAPLALRAAAGVRAIMPAGSNEFHAARRQNLTAAAASRDTQ